MNFFSSRDLDHVQFVPANYCRIFIHSLCWLPKLTALGHVLVLVKIILQPGRLIFITDGLVIFKCRLCSFNVAHKVAVGTVIVATATWNGKKWALIGPFHRIFLFSGGSHHWNLNQFSFDVQCLHMTSFTCELISDIIYKILLSDGELNLFLNTIASTLQNLWVLVKFFSKNLFLCWCLH